MADNDNKIELELALRDSMSPILRTVQDSLGSIVKTLDKTASAGEGGIAKVTQQTQRLNEHVQKTTGYVLDMSKLLTGIGSSLLGPASLVYGIAQVAKMMEGFATAQAQARNFAQDTGFSLKTLSDVQVQFLRNGQSKADADRALGAFAQKFDEIIAKQTSGQFFQTYLRYNADAAQEVLRLVNEGKRWEALQVLQADYMANPEGSRYRAQMEVLLGVEASLWPVLNDNLEHAQTFWIPAISVIDNYLKKLSIWKARKANIWSSIAMRAVAATETDPAKRRSFFDEIRKQEGGSPYKPLPGSNFPGSLPAPGQWQDTKEETNKVVKDIRDYFKKWWDTPAPTPRQEGGPVLPGRDYRVGEAGPEVFGSSGEYTMVGEGGPQVFRPKKSGTIEKLEKAEEKLREKSEQTTAGKAGVGLALKKLAPGPVGLALSVIAADEDKSWRDWARSKLGSAFGYDPEVGAPHPWEPGGSWETERTAALFGKGGKYALEGEGGPSLNTASTAASTEEFSALKYKEWRRSGEIEDYRTFEGVTGVPDISLPGQKGTEGYAGYGRFMPSYKHRGGGLPITQPPQEERIGTENDEYEKAMRERDLLRGQLGGGGPRMNGELSFDNVPPGVRITTENEGFDTFTEHVNKQMAP